MKKILTTLMTVMLVLLVVSPAAFASDMKKYRNDNEHYSILVPSDWEYQDVNNIDFVSSKNISLFAATKSRDAIYIDKYPGVIPQPLEDWSDKTREKFLQGLKNKVKNSTFKESGETYINNHKLLWMKFSDSNIETVSYIIVHNNSLYTIGYLYHTDNREKILPKITESINSLKFDDVSTNWYSIQSDAHVELYVDTNNIASHKDETTNTIYKTVTLKISSPEANKDFAYLKTIFEFKRQNNTDYYRPLSMSTYDVNGKFVQNLINLSNMKDDPSSTKGWSNAMANENMSKIADLLFEKNQ
jgi:hypothetical protein